MRLSTKPATTAMIATIHTLKARAFEDDDTYRGFLHKVAGVDSAKKLNVAAAGHVIDRLRALTGEHNTVRGAVAGLDSPIGRKMRALWIAGYDLGLVTDRTDRAMLSFLQRQTGVSHTRFLTHPAAATSAIEGLKSWLARDGGVEWPADREDVIASKRAVLDAQWRRLVDAGNVKTYGAVVTAMDHLRDYACRVTRNNSWEGFAAHDYDEAQRALGRRVRAVLSGRVR